MAGRTFKTVVSASLAAVALGATALAPVVAQNPAAPAPPRVRMHMRPGVKAERSPNLRRALRALHVAQAALQRADHDSAGHREQALDLVQKAIDQTQQAIRLDR